MKPGTEHFYYIRDVENRPIITICLVQMGTHIVRGVAICSDLDNPCKSIGKSIAQGRAYKALDTEESSDRTERLFVARTWQALIRSYPLYKADSNPILRSYPLYKTDANPILTEFEQRLLKKPAEKYKQQNLPEFLIEKGQFLYKVDGALCRISKQVSEINKSKEQIEETPVGICVDPGLTYDTVTRLLGEIKSLRQQIHELENDNMCFNAGLDAKHD